MTGKKVTILQDRLVHYRVGLFDRLKDLADEKGIDLYLVHGQASPLDVRKRDEGQLDWTIKVRNRWWIINGHDLIWQPFPNHLKDSDLIIMLQHNRILSNYRIIYSSQRKRSKIAFWGHGRNFQSSQPAGIGERVKQQLVKAVDWWFTYTEKSVEVIKNAGFDPSRITCLNNAIDTGKFQADLASITQAEITEIKERYKIPEKSFIGLFCGSIYADKKPDVMVDVAKLLQAQIPGFHFLIIGDGPSAGTIKEAAARHDWIHYLDVKKGRDKAAYFKLSNVVINPGAVGLHVLDAFAAGLPMVTMKESMHGPEISYLVDGYNGYMTGSGTEQYADAVLKLYRDEVLYRKISDQSLADAKKYTVEQMASNFMNGIEECLNIRKR